MMSMLPRNPPRQRGFSLVELMVGVLVGLIGIAAIMRAFEFNESFKRSTGGAGQAQSNGTVALYSLERELRMSGYGFNHSAALACGLVYWHYNGAYSSPPAAAGPNALPPIRIAPVEITDGGAMGNDSLTVVYGTPAIRVLPERIQGNPVDTTTLRLNDAAGFLAGDMVLVAQAPPCMLYNATAPAGGAPDAVQKMSDATGPFNPAGNALFPAYVDGAQVFNLGQMTVNVFDINQNDLRLTPRFRRVAGAVSALDGQPQVLVNDIVAMRAWYGKASMAPPNDVVDTWDKILPTTAAQWAAVKAIKVVLLARSGNYEKPSVAGGACEATTNTSTSVKYTDPSLSPTPPGNNIGTFTVPGGLPSCYKYRSFETTVPLRNAIWKLES